MLRIFTVIFFRGNLLVIYAFVSYVLSCDYNLKAVNQYWMNDHGSVVAAEYMSQIK